VWQPARHARHPFAGSTTGACLRDGATLGRPTVKECPAVRTVPALLACLLAACAAPRPAEPPGCPGAAEIADKVQRFVALQPFADSAPGLTMEAAACGARKFVAALVQTHGKAVGYKAGLTTAQVQQRFGVTAPIRGVLLEKMLLHDGAEVAAAFGARPFVEPDLMVEVGSSAIHDARTPQQVLANLRAVIPFIELADLLVADPSTVKGPTIAANNVGARLGVLGTRIPARSDAAFAQALQSMTVRTVDQHGTSLASAPGAAILGHPLDAVIWLAADLKKDGITLQPGDLLSLGAFGNLQARPGLALRVVYEGLPGNPSVQVRFR
jgi:2-keto-4-pentenoate hydratase